MDDAEIEAAEEQYMEESPLSLDSRSHRDNAGRDRSDEIQGLKTPCHLSIAEATKYPMGSLGTTMHNFTKVLQVDLSRLYRHTVNITRTSNAGQWEALHEEELRAARTVRQVSAVIAEVAKTRNMVISEDLPAFETKAKELLEETLSTMDDVLPVLYVDVQRDFKEHQHTTGSEDKEQVKSGADTGASSGADEPEANVVSREDFVVVTKTPASETTGQRKVSFADEGEQQQQPQHSYANPEYPESSIKLQESIQELSDVIHNLFLEMEHPNPEPTKDLPGIDKGGPTENTSLADKAHYYRKAFLPLVGAMLGGVVAGPMGLAAGAIGSAMGFAGGRFVQRRRAPHDLSAILKRREVFKPQPCSQCGFHGTNEEDREAGNSQGTTASSAQATGSDVTYDPDDNTALEKNEDSQDKNADSDVQNQSNNESDDEDKSGADGGGQERPSRLRTTSLSDDIASDISQVVSAVTGPLQKFFQFEAAENSKNDKND